MQSWIKILLASTRVAPRATWSSHVFARAARTIRTLHTQGVSEVVSLADERFLRRIRSRYLLRHENSIATFLFLQIFNTKFNILNISIICVNELIRNISHREHKVTSSNFILRITSARSWLHQLRSNFY